MGDQLDLFPRGLARSQFERLSNLAEQGAGRTPAELLQDVHDHLQLAKAVYERNRLVNVRLAQAICETITQVVSHWNSLSPSARQWLAGAMMYFTKCDDDEPDFGSPIGFEDDAEVLNACLRFAKLDDLCLNVEDYDNV